MYIKCIQLFVGYQLSNFPMGTFLLYSYSFFSLFEIEYVVMPTDKIISLQICMSN